MSKRERIVRHVVADFVFVASAAAVSFGAWSVYQPAGYVVAGLAGIYASLAIAPGQEEG